MTEHTAAFLFAHGIGYMMAYGAARLGAETEPLTWPAVTGTAIIAGLGLLAITVEPLTGRAAIVSLGGFLIAVIVGAWQGNRTAQAKRRIRVSSRQDQ